MQLWSVFGQAEVDPFTSVPAVFLSGRAFHTGSGCSLLAKREQIYISPSEYPAPSIVQNQPGEWVSAVSPGSRTCWRCCQVPHWPFSWKGTSSLKQMTLKQVTPTQTYGIGKSGHSTEHASISFTSIAMLRMISESCLLDVKLPNGKSLWIGAALGKRIW